MRDHSVMGPAPFSPGVSISREAYPTADTGFTLLQSNSLRLDSKLSAI